MGQEGPGCKTKWEEPPTEREPIRHWSKVALVGNRNAHKMEGIKLLGTEEFEWENQDLSLVKRCNDFVIFRKFHLKWNGCNHGEQTWLVVICRQKEVFFVWRGARPICRHRHLADRFVSMYRFSHLRFHSNLIYQANNQFTPQSKRKEYMVVKGG